MTGPGRVIVVTCVVPGVYFLIFWLSIAFVPFEGYGLVAPLVALLGAATAGRYVWVTLGSDAVGSIWRTMLLWAAIAGGAGFVAGFFLPMLLMPAANQGPLLGIFITGPLGFILGGVAGFIHGLRQKQGIGKSRE